MSLFKAEDLIFSYSRSQAIEDGMLVDLGVFTWRGLSVPVVAGFKYPVACTAAAWNVIAGEISPESDGLTLRVAAVLGVLRSAIVQQMGESNTTFFKVCNAAGDLAAQPLTVALKALIGPGDDHHPVITIMLPNED